MMRIVGTVLLGMLVVVGTLGVSGQAFAGCGCGHGAKAAAKPAAAAAVALPADDIAVAPSCKQCGMDRQMFAQSRMLVRYADGSSVGTCSIHCLAVELMQSLDAMPSAIMVGDFDSKKLIDAETAVWVIGGSKRGVMTRNAKWAFANSEKADLFIKENGGAKATFDQAMQAAYTDMYDDVKMIRERRRMSK